MGDRKSVRQIKLAVKTRLEQLYGYGTVDYDIFLLVNYLKKLQPQFFFQD